MAAVVEHPSIAGTGNVMDLKTGTNLYTNGGAVENDCFYVYANLRSGSAITAKKAGTYVIMDIFYSNGYSVVQATAGQVIYQIGGYTAGACVVVYLG